MKRWRRNHKHAWNERRIAASLVDNAAVEDRRSRDHSRVDDVVVLRRNLKERSDAIVVLMLCGSAVGDFADRGDGAIRAQQLPAYGCFDARIESEIESELLG